MSMYLSNSSCIRQLFEEKVITAKEAVKFLKRDGYDADEEAEQMVDEWREKMGTERI